MLNEEILPTLVLLHSLINLAMNTFEGYGGFKMVLGPSFDGGQQPFGRGIWK